MPQKPKLKYTLTIPHGVTVTSLRVWGTILDTQDIMQGAQPEVGKFAGTIEFQSLDRKLVIELLSVGVPNREVVFNFTTPSGTKVYAEDQEMLVKSNGRGHFYDDQAQYP